MSERVKKYTSIWSIAFHPTEPILVFTRDVHGSGIFLVLTLSVVGINRLSRSRDEQIVQPIIMINEPIEFMSW